jgi:hypothetical protein
MAVCGRILFDKLLAPYYPGRTGDCELGAEHKRLEVRGCGGIWISLTMTNSVLVMSGTEADVLQSRRVREFGRMVCW